jgi:predicted nucleic acid-binding protein
VLRQRAAAAHQSLQEYLRARLIEEADQPTLEEILDRAGGRSGGSVPELADLEVASVLRRQIRAGALDGRRAALALDDLAALPAQRAPHRPLLARCWELRDNLTVYDAAYVALAEAMHAALLTGDRRLARLS